MFMSEQEYNATLDLLNKKTMPSPLLKELQVWSRVVLQMEVYNYLCNTTVHGIPRMQLVVWDDAIREKLMDGPNYDQHKQALVAEKFAELAGKYQMHGEYRDAKKIFVCCETICDEIRKRILKQADREITSIRHPDIWKITIGCGSVHVFYQTDEQITRNAQNGVSENIKKHCTQLVKRYDVHNVFPNGANLVFTSQQTLNEKYAGSMFYYFR